MFGIQPARAGTYDLEGLMSKSDRGGRTQSEGSCSKLTWIGVSVAQRLGTAQKVRQTAYLWS